MGRIPLPIDPLIPEIVGCIERNTLTLLEAEPGAGKTTRVPVALLEAGLGPVYVLEPRRLAARMAARRVALELNERVGGLVGYQVRFEEASGPDTSLFYVTEGVLTRRLLSRRALGEVRTVVLDEFHERHLESDLALALLRRLQEKDRNLRLLIMSATLAGQELIARLGNPPLISAPGRVYPVEIRYMPQSAATQEEQVAAAVTTAMHEGSGHVLVFLPGAAEIRRAMRACEPVAQQYGAKLLPLHGDLSPEAQDSALSPTTRRKIICSTNVAESSVTIDGVQVVIDSGTARVPTYSPWSGLSKLTVERISKASAIQRAGRAGRTGPGLAIRLFAESDFVRRTEQVAPEILQADLTQMRLQLADAEVLPEQFEWIDVPRAEMLKHAGDLLMRLGALNARGEITENGRLMAKLPIHPRLARLAISAKELGAAKEGCLLAALLGEGRMRSGIGEERTRRALTLEEVLNQEQSYAVRRVSEQLKDATRAVRVKAADPHGLEKAVLAAFPDRVGRQKGETILLSSGGSARMPAETRVERDFLVAIEVDQRDSRTVPLVRFAVKIEPDWLLELFPDRIQTREELIWNREAERLESSQMLLYDKLTIEESRGKPNDSRRAAELLVEKAAEAGIEEFTDADALGRFLRRIHFAAQQDQVIQISKDLLKQALSELCIGCSGFVELRQACADGGLQAAIEAKLPMRLIDEIAPAYVVLPSGRRAKIEYHEDRPPSVASRLQDFFGMKQSPTVARGKVPLVVQLLAPNHRPVQVTTDLVSFWKNLYPQVRRELSRRYPKHAWPEVPV